MRNLFMRKQPNGILEVVGVFFLLAMISLSCISPASQAELPEVNTIEIVHSSPEVRAVLGGGAIEILKTDVLNDQVAVVCMTENHPPVRVRLNLKDEKVTGIDFINLPELTESEMIKVIEVARSDPSVDGYFDDDVIANVRVLPYFKTFSLLTISGGDLQLVPSSKMAMVQFEWDQGNRFVWVSVDLDARVVRDWALDIIGRGRHASNTSGGFTIKYPEVESVVAVQDGQGTQVAEIVKSDPKAVELLTQGFIIRPEQHVTFWPESSNYFENEDGKVFALSGGTMAELNLIRGDETWTAIVNHLTGKVERYDYWRDCALTEEERWAALRIVESDPALRDVLNGGARVSGISCGGPDNPLLAGKKCFVMMYEGSEGCCPSGQATDRWVARVDLDQARIIRAERELENGEFYSGTCQLISEEEIALINLLQSDPELGDMLAGGGELESVECSDTGLGVKKVYVDIAGEEDVWDVSVDLSRMEVTSRSLRGQQPEGNDELTQEERAEAVDLLRSNPDLAALLDSGVSVIEIAGDFVDGIRKANMYIGLEGDVWKTGVNLEKQTVLYAYKYAEDGEPYEKSFALDEEDDQLVMRILMDDLEAREILNQGASIVSAQGNFRGIGARYAYLGLKLGEDEWRIGINLTSEDVTYIRMRIPQEPVNVLLKEGEHGFLGISPSQWSPDGSRIAVQAWSGENVYVIYLVNPDGTGLTQLTVDMANSFDGAWSSDGEQIAFTGHSMWDMFDNIYVINADGTGLRQLTDNLADNSDPVWSPDGSRIAFKSRKENEHTSGYSDIYVMDADGTDETQITYSNTRKSFYDWSPDGGRIVFVSSPLMSDVKSIRVANVDGTRQRWIAEGSYPEWSPDASKIVYYVDTPDEISQIYVMNADGSNKTLLTDGSFPTWSPDGSRISFHMRGAGGEEQTWVMDADGGNLQLIPNVEYSTWSPDWGRVAWEEEWDLWVMNVDGSGRMCLTCAATGSEP